MNVRPIVDYLTLALNSRAEIVGKSNNRLPFDMHSSQLAVPGPQRSTALWNYY
jgi:hypothetical protein